MCRFILKKSLMFLITVFIISFLVFACIRIMPGDPIRLIYGDKDVTPEVMERTIKLYHLDAPIWKQYLLYLKDLCSGNLGYSYFSAGKSVSSMIGKPFSVTVKLAFFVFPFASVLGIVLGLISTMYMGKLPDHILNLLMAVITAIPTVPLAIFIVYVFAVKLKWFPIAGWGQLKHLFLPTLVISIWPALNLSKMIRSMLADELQKPYVFFCQARGMGKWRILIRECFPNIMVSVTTKLGMMFGGLLEGALIAELIFNIPGIGRKSLDAIVRRDYPVIMAVVLLSTIIYTLINYLMELLQIMMDPKTRGGNRIE